jgi:hypothetical protein
MRRIIVTLASALALAIPAAATADNYGTNRSESARMTALIYKTFGTGWQGRTMLCIARRESGLNPRAANYHDSNGGSYGLLQLNGVHRWRGESLAAFQQRMWNPVTHLQAAKRLARGGLGPWGGGC